MRVIIDGVTVFYDSVAKSLFMACGDKFEYLLGPFETQDAAVAAGHARSQKLGWISSGASNNINAAKVA